MYKIYFEDGGMVETNFAYFDETPYVLYTYNSGPDTKEEIRVPWHRIRRVVREYSVR